MDFFEYIDNKPLYYAEIDYTRMPKTYEKIKAHFANKNIIHLVGTNGKGTTGRFLATALHNSGYTTGHYTSPHIIDFNERIWKNGNNVTNELIEDAHKQLQSILTNEDAQMLSYFEYTTFLAMLLFNECEYIVLEAGLGGQHDATAVFEKTLTLVTPIDYDHEAFLGSTIKEIATQKLNAIQNNAIISNQKYQEVFRIASKLGESKNIYKITDFLDNNDEEKISAIIKNLSLVSYLQENLKLSIAALKFLHVDYNVQSFANSKLFGRLSRFKENVLLDVGHNVLAASSIVKALQEKKYVLIYNTYADKDYESILSILKPIIKRVEIIRINDNRVEKEELLKKTLNDIQIEYQQYKEIRKNEDYLVFGSFKVIEEFLKGYSE